MIPARSDALTSTLSKPRASGDDPQQLDLALLPRR